MGDRRVAALMVYIAPIARELQETNPEIVDLWRGGATLVDIAEKYDLVSRVDECKEPMAVAKSVVKAYLIGMNGGEYIEEFPGMVSFDEYRDVSWERSRQNIVDYNDGLDDLGAFVGFTNEQHRDFSRWAATRRKDHRGKPRTSIRAEEPEYVYRLSMDEAYRNERGVCWNDVMKKVNSVLHRGNPVRNIKSVRGMAYRFGQSLK